MNTNTETMSPANLQENLDREARYLYDILQARADKPTSSRDDVLVAEAALRHWQGLATVAALVAERDALAERVKALEAIPEDIAQGWDGCYYDDDMSKWSIGDRIRHDAKRLMDQTRAEARNG